MSTVITKGKEGLFYATDPTRVGMLVAAKSVEDAYRKVSAASRLLDSGGKGMPMDGHDVLATTCGTLITVPHASWQTRPQRRETRSILVRMIAMMPSASNTQGMSLTA